MARSILWLMWRLLQRSALLIIMSVKVRERERTLNQSPSSVTIFLEVVNKKMNSSFLRLQASDATVGAGVITELFFFLDTLFHNPWRSSSQLIFLFSRLIATGLPYVSHFKWLWCSLITTLLALPYHTCIFQCFGTNILILRLKMSDSRFRGTVLNTEQLTLTSWILRTPVSRKRRHPFESPKIFDMFKKDENLFNGT